jgi:type II secretory pathway component PulJ
MGATDHLSSERGATLLELLVALAFVGMIAAQVAGWMGAALDAARRLEDASSRNRALWLAFDAMATDIRNAGFSAAGASIVGLAEATGQSLTLVHDANGDGDFDDTGERIRYGFDAAARALRRGTGLAGMQIYVDGLGETEITLTYRDRNGNPIEYAASGLDAAARAAVRRIDIAARSADDVLVGSISVRVRNRP